MCFSAEASFIAGTLLCAGGAATRMRAEGAGQKPLALVPFIFGVQQLIEGGLWLTQGQPAPHWLVALLTYAYTLIAYSLWPAFVPYSIARIESHPLRRKLLRVCRCLGAAVGLFFLFFILRGPVIARFLDQGIQYDFEFPYFIASQWLYGIAILGAAFASGHRIVNLFGVGLVITYNAAKIFYPPTYPSVWCFFAACISLVVYLQVRLGERVFAKAYSAGSP